MQERKRLYVCVCRSFFFILASTLALVLLHIKSDKPNAFSLLVSLRKIFSTTELKKKKKERKS